MFITLNGRERNAVQKKKKVECPCKNKKKLRMKHYYQYMLMVERDFFQHFYCDWNLQHTYSCSPMLPLFFFLHSSFYVTVFHVLPSTIYFPFRPNAPTTFALCENLANKNRFFFTHFFFLFFFFSLNKFMCQIRWYFICVFVCIDVIQCASTRHEHHFLYCHRFEFFLFRHNSEVDFVSSIRYGDV